jgi:hypothetical protein
MPVVAIICIKTNSSQKQQLGLVYKGTVLLCTGVGKSILIELPHEN